MSRSLWFVQCQCHQIESTFSSSSSNCFICAHSIVSKAALVRDNVIVNLNRIKSNFQSFYSHSRLTFKTKKHKPDPNLVIRVKIEQQDWGSISQTCWRPMPNFWEAFYWRKAQIYRAILERERAKQTTTTTNFLQKVIELYYSSKNMTTMALLGWNNSSIHNLLFLITVT